MAWAWSEPSAATLRVDIGLNGDGDIAYDEDVVAGTKAVSFGNVSHSASLNDIYNGGADVVPVDGTRYGLVGTFVNYILGGTADISGARKTVTYKAEEVA